MNRFIAIMTLFLLGAASQAQDNPVTYSRSITKYGGAFTVGDTFATDNLGYGLTTMTYRYFDPVNPGGFYYGLGGADIRHTVGGVLIGDARPATIGWRMEAASPFGFDVSLSPVLGSRTIGNTILGNLYLGIKPMAGIFLVITKDIDVELAYEPVIHLYNFSGSEVRNKTYHDFSLYVMLKKFSLSENLGWYSSAK